MPRDFVLVERDGGSADDGLIGVRGALRSTWAVPTDTFVTADIPLLLTRLSTKDGAAARPAASAPHRPPQARNRRRNDGSTG